jgi:hypothetical protein
VMLRAGVRGRGLAFVYMQSKTLLVIQNNIYNVPMAQETSLGPFSVSFPYPLSLSRFHLADFVFPSHTGVSVEGRCLGL